MAGSSGLADEWVGGVGAVEPSEGGGLSGGEVVGQLLIERTDGLGLSRSGGVLLISSPSRVTFRPP